MQSLLQDWLEGPQNHFIMDYLTSEDMISLINCNTQIKCASRDEYRIAAYRDLDKCLDRTHRRVYAVYHSDAYPGVLPLNICHTFIPSEIKAWALECIKYSNMAGLKYIYHNLQDKRIFRLLRDIRYRLSSPYRIQATLADMACFQGGLKAIRTLETMIRKKTFGVVFLITPTAAMIAIYNNDLVLLRWLIDTPKVFPKHALRYAVQTLNRETIQFVNREIIDKPQYHTSVGAWHLIEAAKHDRIDILDVLKPYTATPIKVSAVTFLRNFLGEECMGNMGAQWLFDNGYIMDLKSTYYTGPKRILKNMLMHYDRTSVTRWFKDACIIPGDQIADQLLKKESRLSTEGAQDHAKQDYP